MVLSRLTKITGPGVATDTNWVGNNADFTGITTTATSFNIGVTTIHSNLIEAHNIKSTGIITATGGSFSGNVTAVDGTFSGNVSIAGTLTYEDVTNIDSVGIITAPALDVDDFLDVGSNIKLGNAGVITATSFVGDGSGLIGVASTDNIVTGTAATFTGGVDINSDLDVDGHTNLDNTNIVGVATVSTRLNINTVSGTRLAVAGTNYPWRGQFMIKDTNTNNTAGPYMTFWNGNEANDGSNTGLEGRAGLVNGGASNERFDFWCYRTGTPISFATQGTERLRINSSGHVVPGADSTYDLGLTGTRFRNFYADTLYGDGSNLTGITGTTINNNADNRVITGSGTANTLEADANLTWNNSTGQLVVGASGSGYISVRKPAIAQVDIQHSTTNSYSRLYMSQSSGSGGYFAINKLGTVDAGYTGGANAVQLWSSAAAPMVFATNNTEKLRITSGGKFGFGTDSPYTHGIATFNDSNGIVLEGSSQGRLLFRHTGGGTNLKMFDIQSSDGVMKFRTIADNGTTVTERVRITDNGDLKVSGSTALSSPNTGYKRISIGNNLILNAGSSAGGYTGFQNNAYVNSSGNWVRVNNDYASSIGMDDGNIYFRNVGAGTGNISWSMPLQIYANGTSTFGSTVTVNGYVLSQGTSGRGGIFGQIKVGHENLYNTIQNSQANTPIHLQYNNTGDINCNEGGGDLRTNDIIPHTNNSSNLGSSTRRWANIHTNDLNLSNEGNTNEVDGTWGKYTIQEGQDNLFLINRRSGKRYKFLLQEID